MFICLNGHTLPAPQDGLLQTLLTEHFALQPGMAVAVNQTVIPASAWASTPLQPNDQVDVFHAVAGG
ncbi:MAG: sulfur carrier protein ThiS [Saccharospirillum sp.]